MHRKKGKQVQPVGTPTRVRASVLLSQEPITAAPVEEERPKSKWLINPKSPRLLRWQLCIALLLIFTAIVTPFEVAFLESKFDTLFVINRMVDLFFLLDMGACFFIPIELKTKSHTTWIHDHQSIALYYMRSWFLIDLISIFPFDIISLTSKGNKNSGNLKVLRIIRCARLVKLVRLAKASTIASTFIRQHGIKNSTVQLLKFLVLILSSMHWLACLWMLVPKLEEADTDWVMKYYDVEKSDPLYDDIATLYVTCSYWAIMTLSTIGYGDVTGSTTGELLVGCFAMAVGASVYAYAVGGLCTLVSNRDPITTAFHDNLERLSNLSSEYDLPAQFKAELSDFVWRSNFLFREKAYGEFYHMLSPGLQDVLVALLNRDWISRVRLFKDLPHEHRGRFLVRVAMAMDSHAYPEGEWLLRTGDLLDCMGVVKFGMLLKEPKAAATANASPSASAGASRANEKKMEKNVQMGVDKLLAKGSTFGTEVLLGGAVLHCEFSIKAVTYSIVSFLKSECVQEILRHPDFTQIAKYLRTKAMRERMWKKLRVYAHVFREMHGTPSGAYDPIKHNDVAKKMQLGKAQQTGSARVVTSEEFEQALAQVKQRQVELADRVLGMEARLLQAIQGAQTGPEA